MSGERLIREVDESKQAYHEAKLKTLAELSCLTYHLTKLPFIQTENESEGKAALRALLVSSGVCCSANELEEIVNLRAELYQQSLARRLLTKKSPEEAQQGPQWIWNKVINEEAMELVEETGGFIDLLENVEPVAKLAEAKEENAQFWLKEVLKAAHALGVKNDWDLFHFLIEKQRRRIALGKTADEWEVLRPLLFFL